MLNLFVAIAVLAGIAASNPINSELLEPGPVQLGSKQVQPMPIPALEPGPVVLNSPNTDSDDLQSLLVGLTDKVASFATNFIGSVQEGIDELLKSGKLEFGDDLKTGIQLARDGLQELAGTINEQLKELAASSATKPSAPKQ